MISVPTGWTLEHLPEAISLSHPRGGSVARIHYKERAGRPKRVKVLAREILGAWPHLFVSSIGPIERMVTTEGELAAVVPATCTLSGRAVQVELGFVIIDDFFSSSMAMTFEASVANEVKAALRDIVRQDNLALGIRRRRFQYRPPARWQPVRRSLSTEWIPPDYPAHDVTLLVYPANPISVAGRATFGGAHTFLESMGWQVVSVTPVEVGKTPQGLTFERQDVVFQRANQPVRRTCIVVLADLLYQYPLELRLVATNDPDADRAILQGVVDSVVPFAPVVTSAIQHWID